MPWLIGRQMCVVHGNPNNPGNGRMTANRVALIDWDESHVDVPDLDLVLPHNAAGLDDGDHTRGEAGVDEPPEHVSHAGQPSRREPIVGHALLLMSCAFVRLPIEKRPLAHCAQNSLYRRVASPGKAPLCGGDTGCSAR